MFVFNMVISTAISTAISVRPPPALCMSLTIPCFSWRTLQQAQKPNAHAKNMPMKKPTRPPTSSSCRLLFPPPPPPPGNGLSLTHP